MKSPKPSPPADGHDPVADGPAVGVAAVAVVLVVFALPGLAARLLDGHWVATLLAAMAAGWLLGLLLARRPRPGRALVVTAMAFAGHAVAALPLLPWAGEAAVVQALPAALALAAAPVSTALLGYALLRGPHAAALPGEPGPFARTAFAAMTLAVLVPLGHWLATALAGAAAGTVQDLAAHWDPGRIALGWIAAALGMLATMPVLLARAEADQHQMPEITVRERGGLAPLLAWAPVPLALWWQPDLTLVAVLPLVLVASWRGPRTVATLGLLTAATIAAMALHPATGITALNAALPALVVLLAASCIAVPAGRLNRGSVELAAAREHLRAVTHGSPALLATIDAQGRHRFANPAYLRWLGLDAQAVIGRSLREVYGDDAAAIAAAVRHASSGQSQPARQVQLADGRAMELRVEPRFSSAGPLDGAHLLAQDTGWRAEHERGLEAMLEVAPEAAVVLDAGGTIVRGNTRAADLLGTTRDQLPRRAPADWLEPATAEALARALQLAADTGQPQALDDEPAPHLRPAGEDREPVPVELALAPLRAGHGSQTLASIRDLRPRRALEQAARDARSQAELTLAAVGEALVACDLEGRITVFNPGAVALSGWPEAQALGRALDEVLRYAADDAAAPAASLLADAIASNAARRDEEPRQLLRRDGSRVAVVESAAPVRDRFNRASGGVVLLRDVSESHAQAQSLAHQALHDHLTGLPNRVLLQDRLSQALAQMDRGYRGALLYLDLDHFKPINDRLGHPIGDRVLQEVASRLRNSVREDDTVSRQGGDEFVLLLVRLADARDAARVADKLIQAIEQPILVDGHELFVSASIGVALFPQDGRDTRTITKRADVALYHAKEAGRGGYRYFTDTMSASAEARLRTEHDLRVGLSNGDFLLEWEPRVQLPGRRLLGAQATLQWRQPDGSLRGPDAFIDVAEETGLVVEIDEWLLQAACRQAVQWQAAGDRRGDDRVPVSVRVSLARFDAERLLAHVGAVLEDTTLAPQCLEVQFPSAQLFAEGERGQALVAGLKALGVRVGADDFTSGASSLDALARFDFDTLLADAGVVRAAAADRAARTMVEAMVGIGRSMGYQVVAKGVETGTELHTLLALGCSQMQGPVFGNAARRLIELE